MYIVAQLSDSMKKYRLKYNWPPGDRNSLIVNLQVFKCSFQYTISSYGPPIPLLSIRSQHPGQLWRTSKDNNDNIIIVAEVRRILSAAVVIMDLLFVRVDGAR